MLAPIKVQCCGVKACMLQAVSVCFGPVLPCFGEYVPSMVPSTILAKRAVQGCPTTRPCRGMNDSVGAYDLPTIGSMTFHV